MKKIVLAVLAGTFCLGATNAFAQEKEGTEQYQQLGLAVTRSVLSEQAASVQSTADAEEANNAQSSEQQPNSDASTSDSNEEASASNQRPPCYQSEKDYQLITRKSPQRVKDWAVDMCIFEGSRGFKITRIETPTCWLSPILRISYMTRSYDFYERDYVLTKKVIEFYLSHTEYKKITK